MVENSVMTVASVGHTSLAGRREEVNLSTPNASETDAPESSVAPATPIKSHTLATWTAFVCAARALVERIQLQRIERKHVRLLSSYRRHLNRIPEDTITWKQLAKLHELRREHKEASDCYRRLANIYQASGNTDEAATNYRQLVRLGCLEPARVYRELAELYIMNGRFDDAAKACRSVIEIYLAEGHRTAATGYLRSMPALNRFAPGVRAALEKLLERPEDALDAIQLPGPRTTSHLVLPQQKPVTAPEPPTARETASLDSRPLMPRPARSKPGSVFLEGTLGRITIFDLVQMVEDNRITGRLLIKCRGLEGIIHFNVGRIVAAENAGGLLGQEALKVIFTVDSGAFTVEYTDRPTSDEIGSRSNTGLLVDVLREIEEKRRESTF
jgi:tetratricopeptide (TPR) repeat protein